MGVHNERLDAASSSIQSERKLLVQSLARFLNRMGDTDRSIADDRHAYADVSMKLPTPTVEFIEFTETITDNDYR